MTCFMIPIKMRNVTSARACENETVQEPQQVGRGGERYSRGSPQTGRGRGCWQGRGHGHDHVHYAKEEKPE